MRSPRLFAVLALAISAFEVQGQVRIEIEPKDVKLRSPSYEAISFVSEGPTYGHADGAVRGRFHRVLFISEGLAYDYPSIRLETLTYGDEGCCRKLIGAKQLSVENLQGNGLELPDAANAELVFVRWRSSHEFEYKYGPLVCRLSGVGRSKVTVACKQ